MLPAVASEWYVACFQHLTCIAPPHKSIHQNPESLAVALSRLIECCTADWLAVMQGLLASVALSCCPVSVSVVFLLLTLPTTLL